MFCHAGFTVNGSRIIASNIWDFQSQHNMSRVCVPIRHRVICWLDLYTPGIPTANFWMQHFEVIKLHIAKLYDSITTPYLTESESKKQWAADTSHLLEITDAPQTWPCAPICKLACQGHFPGFASSPPTILFFLSRCLPQANRNKRIN